MSDVGRYRMVYPRIWRHPGFIELTQTGQLLALYLLSGPQTSRIGLFQFSPATAAEDLAVGVETLRKGLADVSATFGWLFDADARVFYIPSWWRWNPPQNENVLKGNLKDLSEIAASGLVEAFARNLETLPPTLHQTFVECCTKRLQKRPPIQEQDPSSRSSQEHTQDPLRASRAATNNNVNGKLLVIARETLKFTNPNGSIEELYDAFAWQARNKVPFTRTEAIKAINAALNERRTA